MKKIIALIAVALMTTACSAPSAKPCDSSFSFGSSSGPCGPEIEINASLKF
jgi:hypothetical protein